MTFPYLFAPPIFSNLAANCQAHWARFGQYRASSCWYSPMFDYMSAPNPVNYMVPFGYNGGNNNDDDENNGNYWNNYWNNNWANNNGYGYNNRVGNRENSGSTKTGEGTTVEKANVETCKKLLDQIKSYPGISNAQKNIIADAVDQAKDKKSASEKLEIFKEALKKIGPDTIKDVLTSEPNGDFKNEYYDKLLAAGYEYSSTEVDEKIPELKRVLSKLSDSTGNATEADLQGLVDFDAYSKKNADHILDIISSWNTKYGKQDDESRRIITLVGNRYLETEDENIKSAIKDLMGTYITALTNKAEKVKGNLTGEAKGKLQAAIDRLRDADADSDTYSSESGIEELSNKFDA
ncbi:MAG: hypothetical protein MJ231_08700, partial [bacterium]|nr:hypothetical protein [bacterium]